MYINVLTQIGAKAVDQNYIYSVPKELISKIKVGIRVKISFGKMILEGFVTKINPDINYDKTKIKDILDIVDDTPVLNKEMLLLGKDMSNKLLCSLVSAYQVMLPKALKAEINTNIKIKYNKYLKRLKSIEEIDEYIKNCKYESQINILCKLKEGDILITKMTSSITSKDYNIGFEESGKIGNYLKSKLNPSTIILGPTTASMFKINNIYHYQIIIKYQKDDNLYNTLKFIDDMYKNNSKVKVEFDFDPIRI